MVNPSYRLSPGKSETLSCTSGNRFPCIIILLCRSAKVACGRLVAGRRLTTPSRSFVKLTVNGRCKGALTLQACKAREKHASQPVSALSQTRLGVKVVEMEGGERAVPDSPGLCCPDSFLAQCCAFQEKMPRRWTSTLSRVTGHRLNAV